MTWVMGKTGTDNVTKEVMRVKWILDAFTQKARKVKDKLWAFNLMCTGMKSLQ